MPSKVVSINMYKAEKQYQLAYACNFNHSLDTTYIPNNKKRDIAKELQLGYMRLWTNYLNRGD